MAEKTYDVCTCQADPDMRRLWRLIEAGVDQLTASRIVWDPNVDVERLVAQQVRPRRVSEPRPAAMRAEPPRRLHQQPTPAPRPRELDRSLLRTFAIAVAVELGRVRAVVRGRRTPDELYDQHGHRTAPLQPQQGGATSW